MFFIFYVFMNIPFYESVQAWFPSPATDDLKNELSLEDHLIKNPLTTLLHLNS